MTIIACCPGEKESFWIACTKEEAEKWFVPLLDEMGMNFYVNARRFVEDRLRVPENGYEEMIKETMLVNELAYAYFCITRDLSDCYSDVPHHPFHQLWNAYSPFCLCDHVTINTLDELKDVVLTWHGKPLSEDDESIIHF